MKKYLFVLVFLNLTGGVKAQFQFQFKKVAVPVNKAAASGVGFSNPNFSSRPAMLNDERDKPISTLDVTADMEGSLFVNEKSYAIEVGKTTQVPVPKAFSYYFVTKDTQFTTTETRRSLKTHEFKTTLPLELVLKKEYAKAQTDKDKSENLSGILRGVEASMKRIEKGILPAVGDRAKQEVNAFELSDHEVTVEEYEVFMSETNRTQIVDDKMAKVIVENSFQKREWRRGVNGSCDPFGRPRLTQHAQHPVVNVSWEEAVQFCTWLSSKDKYYNYRLPSRAEWEFAAGCGAQILPFVWGTEGGVVSDFANTADASLRHKLPRLTVGDMNLFDAYPITAPVKSFAPNCFGLYDMAGNVAEWCLDVFVSDKPTAKDSKEKKVYKGGSYYSMAKQCGVLDNYGEEAQTRHSGIGFRVCRVRK
jgi:formylglycine-generating enzyme required for sulfatase activity